MVTTYGMSEAVGPIALGGWLFLRTVSLRAALLVATWSATALGSEIVATCDACHGAHSILAQKDPHSRVSDERLIGTCRDSTGSGRATR